VQAPVARAPTPTLPAASVISLYTSDGVYTNVPVDTWLAAFTPPSVTETDVTVAGKLVKKYTYGGDTFAGIEFFRTQTIDATAMTAFHLDVWTASSTSFKVKLVDFGADAAFGGGNDTECELAFDSTTTPALGQSQWNGFDLPLASFTAAANCTENNGTALAAPPAHLAQLIISASTNSAVFIDNVYFHE